MKFLNSGKVKDVYDMGDDTLLFNFSNRVSAYDVKFNDEIPQKGKVLCKFAKFWFEQLDVENHFVKSHSDTEIIVKKMEMLPIECVVRGYFYGSLVSRYNSGTTSLPENIDTTLAAKLPEPLFDPTTKSEHDIPITKDEAIAQNLAIMSELKTPIMVVVTGEGGSGGALAISVGDHLSMLEYATYSVASPEACASIIWRSSDEAEKAAESMKVSAKELKKISIVDEIISEPLGGAHRNYDEVSESIKNSLLKNLKSLQKLSIDKLIERRYQRLLKIGS